MKLPRALLAAAAGVLSAASLTVGILSLYFAGAQGAKMSEELGLPNDGLLDPPVRLAFQIRGAEAAAGVRVGPVDPDGPAARAGLRQGDLIVAVNGRSLAESAAPLLATYRAGRPGEVVELAVVHPGEPAPVTVRAAFVVRPLALRLVVGLRVVYRTLAFLPLAFLVVALPVLFLRLEDEQAWRVAALLISIAGVTSVHAADDALSGPALWLVSAYRGACTGMLAFFCYRFFSSFPARSPVDRRLPWLKWILLALGLLFALGGIERRAGAGLPGVLAVAVGSRWQQTLWYAYDYGGIALALVALVSTASSNPRREDRRKIRVIVWGAVAGLGPAVLLNFLSDLGLWDRSSTLSTLAYATVFLFPLSFAYAVVKHRVLELPVLLKRSARYLLVKRGFLLLLVLVGAQASALFAMWLNRGTRLEPPAATTAGVGFGFLLAALSAPAIRRATLLVDRSFFRDAYDARLVLEELTESIRRVTARDELAALLRRQVEKALHPSGMVVYLESRERRLQTDDAGVPAPLRQIPSDAPGLAELARRGRPRQVGVSPDDDTGSLLAPLGPECLVPIVGREERLLGLVVLGPRRSEEPYSRDDERLLASVASQAGVSLENLALAARMAERLQEEQRAAHEIELARQVQARLLPASGPPLANLDYAGRCVQARAVGGDYFDFLDRGQAGLGLVLADVSGKGFPAALLVASLHAGLRSQAPAGRDLAEQLQTLNRLLYEATEVNRYATVFLGVFDDARRRLRYVNCGHNPPLLVRQDDTVERLLPTAMVIGLIADWTAATAEVALSPGDVLAIYSDGITEATDAGAEEFGEDRLVRAISARRALDAGALLDGVFTEVHRFSAGEQADDQTLVIARVR